MFDILSSNSVTKVVFDGRMDFSALYHEQNVEVQNVLDLQLVDIDSRVIRGEDMSLQLAPGYLSILCRLCIPFFLAFALGVDQHQRSPKWASTSKD